MHRNIPYMFDCWSDPAVHLLLLKSPMTGGTPKKVSQDYMLQACLMLAKPLPMVDSCN